MATPNLTGITSVAPGILASTQVASASTDTTVYTVGGSNAVKLAKMVLTNTSGSGSVTVSVSIVPSGGTVDGTHRVVSNYALGFGDSTAIVEVEGMWLGAGAVISVNASVGAVLDVTVSGLVFT